MIEITPELLRRVLDGDKAAQAEARAMLPQPKNLMGRWATHPEKGRVLCLSDSPDNTGDVFVAVPNAHTFEGITHHWLQFDELEFTPTELVHEADFENAPRGTVVVNDDYLPREKGATLWNTADSSYNSVGMEADGPWQVLRWGKGEMAK